jgi:sugar phosphate permease
VAIVAGAGEACIVVSGPALVGQEAPAKTRGSIIGVVGFFGALGVLIHSKISGMLFDDWMYQAPFIYMAFLNALVCMMAIAVRVIFGSSRGAGVSSTGADQPLIAEE